MTKKAQILVAATLVPLLFSAPLRAQQPADTVMEIRLVDGSTVYGHVVDDGDPLGIRLLSGDLMSVARGRVEHVGPAPGRVRDGQFWRDDPNLTRLFASPTARTLPKGGGYIAAYELVFPFVAVGLSDDILIAAGTPLFGDLDRDRVVYLAPKVRLASNGTTDFAVGGFFFEELGNGCCRASYGALYGVLTSGTPDRAVTLAMGAAYDDEGFLDDPVVMLGAEFRVSRTIKLVTENYFIPDRSLFAFGPRFFGDRLSADLGIALAHDEGDYFTLPIVNFVYVW